MSCSTLHCTRDQQGLWHSEYSKGRWLSVQCEENPFPRRSLAAGVRSTSEFADHLSRHTWLCSGVLIDEYHKRLRFYRCQYMRPDALSQVIEEALARRCYVDWDVACCRGGIRDLVWQLGFQGFSTLDLGPQDCLDELSSRSLTAPATRPCDWMNYERKNHRVEFSYNQVLSRHPSFDSLAYGAFCVVSVIDTDNRVYNYLLEEWAEGDTLGLILKLGPGAAHRLLRDPPFPYLAHDESMVESGAIFDLRRKTLHCWSAYTRRGLLSALNQRWEGWTCAFDPDCYLGQVSRISAKDSVDEWVDLSDWAEADGYGERFEINGLAAAGLLKRPAPQGMFGLRSLQAVELED